MCPTDPIADMLTRIRNASKVEKKEVEIPYSNVKEEIVKVIKKEGYVAWNRSSGDSAINFAYHLGVKRIVLLGFDMHSSNGNGNINHNWHKEHRGISVKNPNFDPYGRFLKPFKQIKKEADILGLEILNATIGSGLTAFPMINIKDVI